MACISDYQRLNLVVFSGNMTVKPHASGYKKDFQFPSEWQKITKSNIVRQSSGFVMRTGSDVGIFGIDIDDPELPHNQELMDLMAECNMIQKTKNGFHYVYKWDPRIKQATSKELKLDTRANGGCLFVAPSIAKAPDGSIVAQYEWRRMPDEDDEICSVPEEVIEYLKKFGDLYIVAERIQCEEAKAECIEDTSSEPAEVEADGDVNVLLKVMDGLSIKRYDNYDSWLKIGIICHNENLPITFWDACSQKSDHYEAGACGRKWLSFKDGRERRLTQGTLWKWLKEDNPTLFYSLQETRDKAWEFIELLNHNDVAEYFYTCNSDNYLYNEKLKWYTLKLNNTWDKSDSPQPSGMKRCISDTMQELVMDMKKTEVSQYARKSIETTDRDTQDKLLKNHRAKLGIINKAYKTLGSSEFCNGVIAFLPSYYEKKDLENIMDMNRNLFAFSDGLFDCESCKFRPISPQDFISVTTGYEYPKKSDVIVRKAIIDVLHGMFEDVEVEQHLISMLASCVYGRNKWEEFYVWTGEGRNGKGMLAALLNRVFGKYYMPVDMKLFTKVAKVRSEPNPTLVEARTSRLMIASEPDCKEKLQTAFVKGISGNDPLVVRTLHSPVEFTYIPQFKVILQCNTIPELSELQQAVMARMKITHFPFSFQKPEDMQLGDPEKNKVQNPNLKEFCEKSEAWRNEMALLLTEEYAKIKDLDALPLPSKIKDASKDYFDTNNPLKQWLEKHFEITGIESDRIGASDMKQLYMQRHMNSEMSDMKFKTLMNVNRVYSKRFKTGIEYFGIKQKNQVMD